MLASAIAIGAIVMGFFDVGEALFVFRGNALAFARPFAVPFATLSVRVLVRVPAVERVEREDCPDERVLLDALERVPALDLLPDVERALARGVELLVPPPLAFFERSA